MAVGLDVALLVDVGVLDAVELGVLVGVNVGITVNVRPWLLRVHPLWPPVVAR